MNNLRRRMRKELNAENLVRMRDRVPPDQYGGILQKKEAFVEGAPNVEQSVIGVKRFSDEILAKPSEISTRRTRRQRRLRRLEALCRRFSSPCVETEGQGGRA